jgi:hypothetical protein
MDFGLDPKTTALMLCFQLSFRNGVRSAVVLRAMPTSQNRDMGHPLLCWVDELRPTLCVRLQRMGHPAPVDLLLLGGDDAAYGCSGG